MELTLRTAPEEFRARYWLKTELQAFCRGHGISAAGSKRELADRVEWFLRTGTRRAPEPGARRSTPEARRVNSALAHQLTLDTVAPEGFRCTQEARRFFIGVLGSRFRFTVPLQRFIREHPGVTLRQIAEAWRRHEEARRSGTAPRAEIAAQFELNRFTRDFFADPRNAGRTRRDCLDAWRSARARPGDHAYHGGDGEP